MRYGFFFVTMERWALYALLHLVIKILSKEIISEAYEDQISIGIHQ
jgi:hypothetical protein